ncbi:MAG: hypothetical protein WA549_01950 [Thermoplasmata archaeon]
MPEIAGAPEGAPKIQALPEGVGEYDLLTESRLLVNRGTLAAPADGAFRAIY